MSVATVSIRGRKYVILEQEEYDVLKASSNNSILPPLPKPDANGNVPAIEYCRASIARDIITKRVTAGLTQKELAKLAGIRLDTLSRIESGTYSPSVTSIDRLENALSLLVKKTNKAKITPVRRTMTTS